MAGAAAMSAGCVVESMLGGGVAAAGVVSVGGGVGVGIPVERGRGADVGGGAVGSRGGLHQELAFRRSGGVAALCGGEVPAGLLQQWLYPIRDDAAGRGRGRGSDVGLTMLLGERSALCDGGDVGTVECDDAVEDVAGFGDVVAVGDHADHVLLAAASDSDIEDTTSRRRRHQRDAGGDVA